MVSTERRFSDELPPLDIIIVGGGINGAGIAAEAASRGLSVGIYEAKDFAGATSSASSKLIHGGLRYLEYGEFRLVKEALSEREILLTKAAHLIKPMRFRLPHLPHLRPQWQIKAGLFLYDHLAKRCLLKRSELITLSAEDGLSDEITSAFEYSDCWVDDSRLVISNLLQAEQLGAEVRNYCQVIHVERDERFWKVTLFDQRRQRKYTRHCRALINATGPWAATFVNHYTPETSRHKMRLVKGSHLITAPLYQGDHAYILQNHDKRVVFVIPYLGRYSMIGTTDIPFDGDPYTVKTDQDEIDYLLSACNQYFQQQLKSEDIIDCFSGVRPLFDNKKVDDAKSSAQAISRDYELTLQYRDGEPPLMTIFGGKLTTYRTLSIKAIDALQPFFPALKSTNPRQSPLPGSVGFQREVLVHQLNSTFPSLASSTIDRLIAQYGTRVWLMLQDFDEDSLPIVADLYPFELNYLLNHEWALTVEDIVKRRTKLLYDCDVQALAKLENRLA